VTPDDPYGGFLESYLSQQAEQAAPAAAAEEARPGEWRTVWTWIERVDGEVLPACLELLGRGREVADELGTRNCAVVFGHELGNAPARLGEHGADRVYVLDAPEFEPFQLDVAREALTGLIQERRPEILLLPATVQGRNLGAQVATALGTGIVPNCNALSLDATERLVIGHQTSFEERLLSDVVIPNERPQIFTVTPGSYRRPPRDAGRNAQVVTVAPTVPRRPVQTRLLGREPDRPRRVDQFDAVVGAGLGLASADGFGLAVELAQELDAYAGATRGAVACGWAEKDRLLSVAKHKLRPRLYVAAGVVGEYDHLKAIEGADLVVALTEDPNAPIVDNADLVGIGDPAALLPRLLDHLRKAKRDQVRLP
jgi:electron transfer flavoprotein alpha subunit